MKLRLAVAFVVLALSEPLVADPKPVALNVKISRVLPDYLVAELVEVRVVSSGPGTNGSGGGTSTRTRTVGTGRLVVLTPAGKCAVGDRFHVVVREEGTKAVDDQPLRRYRVLKATRR